MKIGEIFYSSGLITDDELKTALDEQTRTHDRLGDIILRKGYVTQEEIAPILADYFHISYLNIKEVYKNLQTEIIDTLPEELARKYNVIPVNLENNILTIATFDPLNLQAIDNIRLKTGYKIKCAVSAEKEIKEAIDYCYEHLPRMKQHIKHFIDTEVGLDETEEKQAAVQAEYGAGDQPVVQFVKSLIVQAVNSRASDILLQPKNDIAELRFRIDGVLYNIDPPPKAMLAAINTRIKILAGLDIAERRLPQDGRFKVSFGNSEVDIRVSSFPTIYGESVVMRVLKTDAPLLGLEQLGLYPDDLVKFRSVLNHSYGLILVTGPTGSGKTTTLYTSLNEIKSNEKNIVTLEDPVEYRLPFIQQSQINPTIGFDFARGLRSLLRQDPDVMMVGEIRDRETAEIAIHAALTGHLVFSTLHTNDAAGAAIRLIKMGVEPFLITSSLLGVVAQRLIRTICPECKNSYPADQDIKNRLGINGEITTFFRGAGCPKCMGSGYHGRKGIFEVMIPNEEIRRLILQQHSSEEIRAAAQRAGMKTLRDIGMTNLREGTTTPEEVLRVTQETEEL